MPDIITNTSGRIFHSFESVGGAYERDSIEALDNAAIVYNMLNQLGWSINAVGAICGCMFAESGFNPGQKETSSMAAGVDGTGLLQWTRSSGTWQANNPLFLVLNVLYGHHTDWIRGEKQINALAAEYQTATGIHNWGVERQWYGSLGRYWRGRYGLSCPIFDNWAEWATATTVSNNDLVDSFVCTYLRPSEDAVARRIQVYRDAGAFYLDYLGGIDPGRRLPVWLLFKLREMMKHG